jgi:hypothetical protein
MGWSTYDVSHWICNQHEGGRMTKEINYNNYAFADAVQNGLTKREYYAARAMQGLAHVPAIDAKATARAAVEHADALIAELEKVK